MKITIITVCYNAENVIEKTLRSVLLQSFLDYEYLIIDGKSKDNTLQLIKEITSEYPDRDIKIISEYDDGIYDAMNKGINQAEGEWLNFMNAGDVFLNDNVLSEISTYLVKDHDVVYGDYLIEKRGRQMIVTADQNALSNPSKLKMGFNHQASFVKKELALKYPFDLKYQLAADFNMMVSLYKEGANFYYVELPVVKYDLLGVSNKKIWRHRYECLSVVYPTYDLINRIRACFYSFRLFIKSSLANYLYLKFPFLLNLYYDRKKDFHDYK